MPDTPSTTPKATPKPTAGMPGWLALLLGAAFVMVIVAGYQAIHTRISFDRPMASTAVFSTFFFHVPASIVTYALLTTTAVCGLLYLINPKELFDRLGFGCLEVAFVFGAFVLISGILWARQAWNVWWTWEPRLTSMLTLWFLVLGALLLRGAVLEREKQRRLAAIFGVLIFPAIPFVHYATKWFGERMDSHPAFGSAENVGGYKEHYGLMLFALLALTLLASGLVFLHMRIERQAREAERLRRRLRALE